MTISWLKTIMRKSSLAQEIAYTMTSFLVLAFSGILINIIITLTRNAQSLGVFNLSYIIYLILAQVASIGVHYSVLRNSARYKNDEAILGKLLGTGALMSFFSGVFIAFFLYWLCQQLKPFFTNESSFLAITYSMLGLILFPLNKVSQAYLNGLKHIKAFSIIQSVRYIIVMAFVSIVSISSLPIEYASLSFFAAELITAILGWWYIYNKTSLSRLAFDITWMKSHWLFGVNAFLFTILADVNAKMDVILIAIFLNEKSVGIYSFLAMLVDGLYHALSMIRINFNPTLVVALNESNWTDAQQMLLKSKQYIFPITLILAFLIFICFYIFSFLIAPEKGLQQGLMPLFILLSGLTMISFLIPFDNLMVVSGYPGYQTIQQIAVVLSNLAVATILIFNIGIVGAAIGTIVGYLAGVAVLIILAKRLIGWNLVSNTYCGVN